LQQYLPEAAVSNRSTVYSITSSARGEQYRWDIEVVWLLETVESAIANELVVVGASAETEPAWA
jgi:hypothetical protein